MNSYEQFIIKEQSLCLSADRSIFWENQNALIVSDLHFGKTGHFRKAGIAVPQSVFKEDMQRLMAQIQFFKPASLVVVGDMFHSSANKELELFARWRENFGSLSIKLVKGNHDILQKKWYSGCGIELHEHTLHISSFCFQHDPGACTTNGDAAVQYVFSGHLHPGITLSGIGRQTLRFPCFYFANDYCILPAFSRFTGMVSVQPEVDEVVFAIVNNSVVKVRGER